MFPTFYIFGNQIGLFAIMAICGGLTTGFWACHTARKRGHNDNHMIILLLFAALGAFLGGQLLFGLLNFPSLIILFRNIGDLSFSAFVDGLRVVFGGTIFFGGLMGSIFAGLITARILKLPILSYTDMLAPAIPLFHAFGRIGCFLAGCCFGIEHRIGFTFTNSLLYAANNVRRLPIQLIESFINLLLFILLASLLKRDLLKGHLLLLYIIFYSIMRFVLEFWRGDVARGFILGLSTSQFISLVLITLAGLIWIDLRKRAEKSR